MIKPSKKYIDYVKAINNMYKLGFFHQFEVPQEKFDRMTLEQQNKLIADVMRIRSPEQYVVLNDGVDTKMDKALYNRIIANTQKTVKSMPQLGKVGWTGQPIYAYFREFNPDKMIPQMQSPLGKTSGAIVRIVRNNITSEIDDIIRECPFTELKPDYIRFRQFVDTLPDDKLLVMVEETDGLKDVLEWWWKKYLPKGTDEDAYITDNIENTRMLINGIMAHRW